MTTAAVVVAESVCTEVQRGELVCLLGRDLRLTHKHLANFCWRNLQQIDVDLLVLAGGIAYADRTVRRRQEEGWPRRLTLRVPVTSDRWDDTSLRTALREAVEFVTGDYWDFEFYRREHRDFEADQRFFEPPTGHEFVVVPYSGGLDSYAAVEWLRRSEPIATPFLVTTEHGSRARGSLRGKYEHHVGVPIRIGAGGHAEPTYRSRTFLFFVVAAIASKLAKTNRIVIGEAGQGAIGAALVPFGDEPAYVGSHPAFTHRLRAFLRRLWGDAPVFEHPFVWRTKRQVLSSLIADGATGWATTVSCSRDLRRVKGVSGRVQCGVCGGCLHRRVALQGFGASSEHGPYFWQDLGAQTMGEATSRKARRPTTNNDEDIARHAILTHCALADLAADSPSAQAASFELGAVSGEARRVVQSRLVAMLASHRDEWMDFVSAQDRRGWFALMEGGCHHAGT
jgi:7-cyano-7-deazaguanine synthase in queuosine biosynthesis